MPTNEEKIKWFDVATKFQIEGDIFLIMKSRVNGDAKWAIEDFSNHNVLNSNMEWEPELPVAQRDEGYLIRRRLDFDRAVVMFQQYKMFAE